MSAKTPRLNIAIDDNIAGMLADLARQQQKSLSMIARELLTDALERHEDRALSTLAEQRDQQKTGRISHQDAW